MSRIGNLRGKGKMIEMSEEGFESKPLEIKPMTMPELADFAELQNLKGSKESMAFAIKNAIRKDTPDATDEEMDNIGPIPLNEIIKAIIEVNGLEVKKAAPELIKPSL